MKVVASTNVLAVMAGAFRDFGRIRRMAGDGAAADTADMAADALDDLAQLRAALTDACEIAERAFGTDYGFNYESSIEPRKRIEQIRGLLAQGGGR